jgi:hypothetical protein
MTPESKIKRVISTLLKSYGHEVFYYMPVPTGYGGTIVDYVGFCCGLGFAIEAKAPGRKPTVRQKATMEKISEAGAKTFIIDGPKGVGELDEWLTTTCRESRKS